MSKEVIIFNSEINNDSIRELIDNVDKSSKDNIVVYFSSHGGFTSSADVIVDYLNNLDKNITIKGFGAIESAAFTVLCRMNCKIEVLNTCTGMIHLIKNSGIKDNWFNRLNKRKSSCLDRVDDENIKALKIYRKKCLDYNSIEEFKKGKNVYFSNKQMREIFENEK